MSTSRTDTIATDGTAYPSWVTADARIRELAEWLHNRDFQHHRWMQAERDERLHYCAEARQALRFIDEVA